MNTPRGAALLAACAGLALLCASRWRPTGPAGGGASPSPSSRRLSPDYRDPRTVALKEPIRHGVTIGRGGSAILNFTPLRVCERAAPILPDVDQQINRKYGACPLLHAAPENTTLLLIDGIKTFGRTGNNLIELLHGLQHGKDSGAVVGLMQGSWATHLITDMWMAIQDRDRAAWKALLETTLCIKIFERAAELKRYKSMIRFDSKDRTRDLFMYRHRGTLNQYIEFQGHILRTLYRFYNTGTGANMRRKPVGDMCSVLDASFGEQKSSAVYSVIHSRSLEGEPGLRLLGRIAGKVGCDPVAALDMEPDYVKAILAPLGMLGRPILFLTDGQRPEILERLQQDPDIGANIVLVPAEASWVGGDITAAIMADVFIGNPASTFSGFIAKTRVAFGYRTNFLFRKRDVNGEWVDVCDERGIFDTKVMNVMA